MSSDIRVSVDFFDHPKTVKLQRRCTFEGIVALQKLWAWAAVNRSSGVLSGMDGESVEIASRWSGEEGRFIATIVDLGFVDEVDGVYVLHDWVEHNPWAAGGESRSDKARFSRMANTHPEVYRVFAAAGRVGITSEEYGKITSSNDPHTTAQRVVNESLTVVERNDNVPLTPAPSPKPTPSKTTSPPYSPPPSSAAGGEKPRKRRGRVDDDLLRGFNRLWQQYPKKEGRAAAVLAFKASVRSYGDLTQITVALKHYLQVLEIESDRPMMNGSKWFKNWQDYVSPEVLESAKAQAMRKNGRASPAGKSGVGDRAMAGIYELEVYRQELLNEGSGGAQEVGDGLCGGEVSGNAGDSGTGRAST